MKNKDRTPVSIFIFDKKSLNNKSDATAISNYLKADASQLKKLKHPNILDIQGDPLEDNKMLVIITERVAYSLAYLQDNYKMKRSVPGTLEIKMLILEVMEAIHFLHNNAKMAHLGISPENIYITPDGKVRMAGFYNSV